MYLRNFLEEIDLVMIVVMVVSPSHQIITPIFLYSHSPLSPLYLPSLNPFSTHSLPLVSPFSPPSLPLSQFTPSSLPLFFPLSPPFTTSSSLNFPFTSCTINQYSFTHYTSFITHSLTSVVPLDLLQLGSWRSSWRPSNSGLEALQLRVGDSPTFGSR